MRAVVGCATVSLLLVFGVGRARGGLPVPKLGEPTCEEQCRQQSARDDAACDDNPFKEWDRALCHEATRARLEVCLRICED